MSKNLKGRKEGQGNKCNRPFCEDSRPSVVLLSIVLDRLGSNAGLHARVFMTIGKMLFRSLLLAPKRVPRKMFVSSFGALSHWRSYTLACGSDLHARQDAVACVDVNMLLIAQHAQHHRSRVNSRGDIASRYRYFMGQPHRNDRSERDFLKAAEPIQQISRRPRLGKEKPCLRQMRRR